MEMRMNQIEQLFSLSGKRAVVTGGATGIGRMVAEALLSAGASVMIGSRKLDACTKAAEELNCRFGQGRAYGFQVDVSSEEGTNNLWNDVQEKFSDFSILVNNSGKAWVAESLAEFPRRGWDGILATNVTGLFAVTQKLLPMLRAAATSETPSRIVNIGSIVGTLPIGNFAYSYAASKAAVHHLTRILAQELASANITVNAIAPGPFPSRMSVATASSVSQKNLLAERIPLHRWGEQADLAATILFLCGKGGGYVTGAIIPLDGGMSADCKSKVFQEMDTDLRASL